MKYFSLVPIFTKFLIFGLIAFYINQFITSLQLSNNYFICGGTNLSTDFFCEIKNFIHSNLINQLPTEIFKSLKNNYSMIESINLTKKVSNISKLTINEFKPIYKINSDSILTNNGIFDKKFFKDEVDNSLNEVYTTQKTEQFVDFVKQLDPQIVQHYEINWINKHLISMKLKNENLKLLIKHDYIPNPQILQICKKLQSEKQTVGDKREIIADLRFSNQIIICQI